MKLILNLALAAVMILACARSGAIEKYVEEAAKLAQSGDPAKAVEVMDKAAKQYPRSARAHAYLGLYLGMKAGRASDFAEAGQLVQAAFEHLDRAVALDSLDPDARFSRGLLSVQVPDFFGRLEPGVRDLEFLLRRSEATRRPLAEDRLVTVWSMLGAGYQKLGRMEKAKEAWQKVAELARDETVAAQAKARLSAIGAQDTGAAQQEATDLPDDPAVLRELGRRYLDSGDFARAAEPLRKAAKFDSTNLEGLKMLARTLEHVARSGYDERIALNTDLRTRLAFEYYRVLDRAVRLAPKDMELRLWRGAAGAYTPFFVGKLDDAVKDLETVAASNVSDENKAQALYLLGLAFRHKGTSYWTTVASKFAKTEAARQVLEAMRPPLAQFDPAKLEKPATVVSFVLGFQDELAPQTAVWVEDEKGGFLKTLYVSGFSGHAKAAQVDLPHWAKTSAFRGCDAVTGASIDLGQHVYAWDLRDCDGKRVKPGSYVIKVEAMWWPSMKYEMASVRLAVGGDERRVQAPAGELIPSLEAEYLPR
jgi:tetratricopeptide (TPR) repeat protein